MSDASPSSRIIPNTFQTPNLLTDEAMRLLTGNEVKCYLVIVRKTFGWHKQSDRISRSQIMELAGLGEHAVDSSMAVLVEHGLVVRLAENDPTRNIGIEWALQLDDRLIQWTALAARATTNRQAKADTAALARSKKGMVDGQPHLSRQGRGMVDGQGTQKPLSKANKYDDEYTSAQKSKIAKTYEQEIGALTPLIADALREAEAEFPAEWILEAITIAVERNVRNWKFVRAILEDCKAKGVSPNLNKKPAAQRQAKSKNRADASEDPIKKVLGE